MEALAPGTVIAGRFVIERAAATGSFGAIYLALDRHDQSRVALKLLLRETDAGRFEREARVLSEIRDEGVVPYVGHGVDEAGRPWLAMRWLEGQDLDARLTEGPLTVAETIALGVRITHGVGAAHARGVIHRDVKPTNIFLVHRDPAQAVLLDFGIARSKVDRTRTAAGIVVGTPGYLAPEQARADADIDARADVFALGAVLWECIAGRPVFDGATVMAILTKILFEPAPRLDQVVPGVPRALADLVAKALHKEPTQRPRDGTDFAEALAALGPRPTNDAPARISIGDVARVLSTVLVARDHDPPRGVVPTWPALAAKDAARLETLADGTVAVLVRPSPVATDQAESAARMALAMKTARPSLAIGVATGRGVTADGTAMGEIIARAAALVGAAPGIVVDATTAGLVSDRFRMRLEARGAVLIAEDPAGRRIRRLFGRERELELAQSLFSRALEESSTEILVVTSEPGMGKTALVREVIARIAAHDVVPTVWQVQGEALREGEPWALLGRLVRSAGDGGETEPARARTALERWARDRLGPDPAALAFVLDLAGLGEDEESQHVRAARESQGVYTVHATETLSRLLRAESVRSPVLFVIEDAHHADAASFDAICGALVREAGLRVLVVVTARLPPSRAEPERLEPLLRAPRVTRVSLGRLGRRAAEELVREGLGRSDELPTQDEGGDPTQALEAKVQDICARADGSPFLLGELVRAERAGVVGLPGTVSAVVSARFDALPGLARRVLRAASVLGGGTIDDVLAVTGPLDVESALEELVQTGILTREPGGRLAFRNALFHEVAYGMLTPADRSLAHRLVAERLEASGSGSAVLVAEHWQRAGDPGRAAAWLGQAARDALATDDVRAAVRFAERALPSATGVLRGDLLATVAEARLWTNDVGAAAAAASEALALLPRGTRAWCRAAGASAVAEGRLGHADALEALGGDLVLASIEGDPQGPSALATALARVSNHLFFLERQEAASAVVAQLEAIASGEGKGDPLVEMRLCQALAIATRYRGDLSAHVAWSERAFAQAEALGDRRTSALLVTNLGDALRNVGRAADAVPLLKTGIEAARSLGLSALEAPLRLNLGMALTALGRHDEAAVELDRAMVCREVVGDARVATDVALHHAESLLRRGRVDDAAAIVLSVRAELLPSSPYQTLALLLGARVAEARGDLLLAQAEAEAAVQTLVEGGVPADAAEAAVWIALAEIRRKNGDGPGAEEAISSGWSRVVASLEALGELREAALKNVPELARLEELAIEIGLLPPSEVPVRDTLPP